MCFVLYHLNVYALVIELGMSLIKSIYPIADIEGCLRNIASQCDSGDLERGSGSPEDVDNDNIDVAAVLRELMELIKVTTISPRLVSRC